ncbi:MAG: hypothetical protein PVH88_21515 [Ignavibacteria bacterium]|jgi:hypothetical protein
MEHNRNLQKENYESFDDLYRSIEKEGSLGLLALGYRGLEMWRKKRKELENKGEKPDAE